MNNLEIRSFLCITQPLFIGFIPTLTEIVESPMSTTVFLNHPAMFTCEYIGSIFFWEMDGVLLSAEVVDGIKFSHLGITGSSEQGAVMFPARLEYNETAIQCGVLGTRNVPIRSEPATLTIQGKH